jgi:hypothetical protein
VDFIKNYNLILQKIPVSIQERDFKLVSSIRYYIDYNEHFEKVSFLEVGYILETKAANRSYQVLLGFSEVTALKLSDFGGAFNQIIGFKITDMKDRCWESSKRYYVHDYENDVMSFYCRSMEVLSVEEK